MSFCVVLIDEVYIVGTHKVYVELASHAYQLHITALLQFVGLAVGTLHGVLHFVALQFEVVVVAKQVLEPQYSLFGLVDSTGKNLFRHLAADTCRTADEAFVEALDVGMVGARTRIESVDPCTAHYLDEVVVALLVFGKQDEVPSAAVDFLLATLFATTCTIDLAAEYGLEVEVGVLAFQFLHVVEELFDAEHVAVVGDGKSALAVVDSLVDQLLYTGLAVEYGILGVGM